ncbi:hypothetical protein [Chryseobacterium sp. 3008163]|uniref:hypothetical protein n=1 Tax=Chryseobacterium sp. 3008163 TaxID=2478663 RepID=UPI000F0C3ABF|nr:hypothetical protein [Chryseobacterium sp. 3008163]AYM99633.1 hypothetical protein EAG08_04140 [Chryseobacterium sp. 3008163]
MANESEINPGNPQPNRINWLAFFQSLDTKYGRLGLFSSILVLGYTGGYFSSSFIKDREIVILERQYNDLKSELNLQKIQFETERSDHKVEMNRITIILINTRDSLKNGRKK